MFELVPHFQESLKLEQKGRESAAVEVAFDRAKPMEDLAYTLLTRTWKAAFLAVVTGKSGAENVESHRFPCTPAAIEREQSLAATLAQESQSLLGQIKIAQASFTEFSATYQQLQKGLHDFGDALVGFNSQCAALAKNRLAFTGNHYAEMAEKLLSLKRLFPAIKLSRDVQERPPLKWRWPVE